MLVNCVVFAMFVAYMAPAWTEAQNQLSVKCSSKSGLMCNVPKMELDGSTQSFVIHDADSKTGLNIKAGSIDVLTMQHCERLLQFEKLIIGRIGLGELCVVKTFRHVSAENNNIRTLNTNGQKDGKDFSIEVLQLNGNKISSLESMRDFVALKELHLERNVLTTLDMGAFERMKHLEKLYLGNNRLVKITGGAVEFPRLSLLGLANNTLTKLNVQQWNMGSLTTLELASNNLTQMRGLETLTTLYSVTLAGNGWECLELENMLETLDNMSATIGDADQHCDGIRNSSICCRVYPNSSENALLDELKKYTLLKERYDLATRNITEQILKHTISFNLALEKMEKTMLDTKTRNSDSAKENVSKPHVTCYDESENKKAKSVTTNETEAERQTDEGAPADHDAESGNLVTTEPPPIEEDKLAKPKKRIYQFTEENCICPKKVLDTIGGEIKALQARIEATEKNITRALADFPQLHRQAMLTRHEFRTMVKRGDQNLFKVNMELEMLRNHIKGKLGKAN